MEGDEMEYLRVHIDCTADLARTAETIAYGLLGVAALCLLSIIVEPQLPSLFFKDLIAGAALLSLGLFCMVDSLNCEHFEAVRAFRSARISKRVSSARI